MPYIETTTQIGRRYRQIVSTSMPQKPKALSPSTRHGLPVSIAAAMGKAGPMPMTPGADIGVCAVVNVNDAAREIKRVGAFVDEDGVGAP